MLRVILSCRYHSHAATLNSVHQHCTRGQVAAAHVGQKAVVKFHAAAPMDSSTRTGLSELSVTNVLIVINCHVEF